MRHLNLGADDVDRVASLEAQELTRREQAYRGDWPPTQIAGRTVILIDDGLATGATMRAAAQAVQAQRPARLIVAVPVGANEPCEGFRNLVDEVVCALTPEPFDAVGRWYEDFSQTSEESGHSCAPAVATAIDRPVESIEPYEPREGVGT